jgi:hypothetical protein
MVELNGCGSVSGFIGQTPRTCMVMVTGPRGR